MFLSDRRVGLIHFCLAGMEAAWLTPVWLLLYWWTWPLWTAYAAILSVLLMWTLALELLSRTRLKSPAYDAVALGLMILTSLLAVRLVVYAGRPVADLTWLMRLWQDAGDLDAKFPPVVALIATNLILWQRATAATSRDIGFFGVGLSFRAGLILLIATAGVFLLVRGESPTVLLWVYMAFGLAGAAIARIHDKASGAQTAGSPLPVRRMVQLLLAVGATVGGTMLLSRVYNPAGLRAFAHWLDPLWRWFEPIATAIIWILAQVLDPVLTWLEATLSALLRRASIGITLQPLTGVSNLPEPTERFRLPPQVVTTLSHIGLALGIALAVLMVVGLLLLYLERSRRGGLGGDVEEEGVEELTFGGSILRRSLQRVRDLAALMRRYGFSRRLLEAISVQNIYANLCRIARQRGYGRRPSQPPDAYLPILEMAFPAHDEALRRITAAYMRVHYGDRPVTGTELAQVRDDYMRVRTDPAAENAPSPAHH